MVPFSIFNYSPLRKRSGGKSADDKNNQQNFTLRKGHVMKTDALCEYFAAGTLRDKIDRGAGIIRNVKIIGLTSRNNRYYPESTLRAAAPLYENAKVNLNHPDGSPRDVRKYQDRFGLIKNVHLAPGDGLFGDFHFNPKHALAEQFLWDAENSPENVGFSHNVEAVVTLKDGQQTVEKIEAVRSVDLVADPATTCGLFEQINTNEPTANDAHEPIKPDDTLASGDTDTTLPLTDALSPNTLPSNTSTKALERRAALLERILNFMLESPISLNGASHRKFAALLLETENPDLAEKLLAERLEFRRSFDTDETFSTEPIRSVAPETLHAAEVSTEEFVRRIAR